MVSRYWFVAIILAVSFVGIFDHDLWTSDEPRVAEIGREFLDDNVSLAVPRLNGEPFLEKPPLYFWCVALSYKIFGGPSASAARIPSLFFGLGTLVFTYLLSRRMFGRNAAMWSCMVLALSTEFFYINHKSLVDPSLVFFVTGTVYWLYLALTAEVEKKWIYYTICYIFTTGGFFAKGFVGIVFPALLFLCWIVWIKEWREIKRARPWIGIVIVSVCIAPWLWFLWKEGSWEYINTFLIHNNLQRFVPGSGYTGGHKDVVYTYLVNYWQLFLPWSILTPAVLFSVCRKGVPEKRRLFLLLWFMSGLLMLSLAGTKRGIYLVPIFPPIAILTGLWFHDVETRKVNSRVDRLSQWSLLCFFGIGIVVFIIKAFKHDLFATAPFILSIPVLAICFIAAFRSFIKNKIIKLRSVSILLGLIYLSGVLTFYPYINEHKSFRPFCEKLGKILTAREGPLYAFQPDEITRAIVPFYTNRYIMPIHGLDNIESLGRNYSVLMLVVDRHGSAPLYKSISEVFPNVLLSEHVNKRYIKLVSSEGK
ncbi:MAG: putative glycosyltransferase [Candidatus Scalindua brodae]|uniref:Putative glycosyltransferase n=1 Tax=Candidatus Scalindua brodae TaxID=237368 RepID=A0A0B0EKL0_9BACT|nr:MAG: putative glycosyltransferase [Candidatus Scalindua brodae]